MSGQPPGEPAAHPAGTDVAFPLSRRGDVVPDECAWLRDERPVARVRTLAGDPAWLVSTYDLATRVLEDETFSLSATAAPGARQQYAPTFPVQIRKNLSRIKDEGMRDAVMQALSPRAVKQAAGRFRQRADALIDEVLAEGPPVDLKARFTDPYTAYVMCTVLGLPDDDWRRLMSGLDISIMTTPRPFEGTLANWDKGMAHMAGLLRAPGATDAPGLLGALARLRADSGDGEEADTDEHLTMTLHSLFEAGAVSTAAFLTLAIMLLLRDTGQRQWLADHPEAIGPAVEELLRYNLSIGDALARVATRDTELGGTPVAAGDLVLVLVEGANHDPAVFRDPGRLDLTRTPNPHLAFGSGRHYCPATALARAHAATALTALLARLPGLRLAIPADEVNWRSGWIKRTPERLPVLW
ncbi:cytochrome P450 [Streptomyces paromomycinus]|uniref:Mycocyclosin synthase n=1 Tax=Streptomyces paromomycinus TaxID=92743 RepID=A0A401W9F5_STREY|nr:cytochrome P450 [Streptomyces paromomycinus]GCD45966.1 mycocyclosin synthase [Streptomyces paromomycinus]